MIYVSVCIAQILFNIFKVLEIRYTLEHDIRKVLINSVWINLVSLIVMYYSLDALFKGNFLVILFYITGSVLGKYLGMKIEVKKSVKRKKSFNLLELI